MTPHVRPLVAAAALAAALALSACGGSGQGAGAPPRCGDGVVNPGEECDDGNGVAGDGCEPDCRWTCLSTDTARDCSGALPVCVTARACNDSTHVCVATNDTDGTSCGSGLICVRGACVSPSCGDGVLDTAGGEQCDDANGTPANLDGCDQSCRYELFLRANAFAIAGTLAPSFCATTANRLGTQSFTGTAVSSLNSTLQAEIGGGTMNVLFQLLGLDDLAGAADGDGLSIGVVSATLDPAKGTWPGGSPIDWWFLASGSTVDADGLPSSVIPGATLAAHQLRAGPSDVTLAVDFGTGATPLRLRSAAFQGTLDATPAANTPAPPPTLLAPGLAVVQTFTASGPGQGLCGAISVESLAHVPVPSALAAGGATPCLDCSSGSKAYTSCGAGQPVGAGCNSLLDVLVAGCKVGVTCLLSQAVVNPYQPDVFADPAGAVTTLAVGGAANKIPAAQTDGNQDGYSSFFTLTGNRAHVTGRTP